MGWTGLFLTKLQYYSVPLKHRLQGKFGGNFLQYRPLLGLINQKHWRWQIDKIWKALFNRPIQADSYSMIEILINLP